MIDLYIEEDVLCPAYNHSTNGHTHHDERPCIQVDNETLDRWNSVWEQFNRMQDEMSALYEKQIDTWYAECNNKVSHNTELRSNNDDVIYEDNNPNVQLGEN
jgi:hypothetical protein